MFQLPFSSFDALTMYICNRMYSKASIISAAAIGISSILKARFTIMFDIMQIVRRVRINRQLKGLSSAIPTPIARATRRINTKRGCRFAKRCSLRCFRKPQKKHFSAKAPLNTFLIIWKANKNENSRKKTAIMAETAIYIVSLLSSK